MERFQNKSITTKRVCSDPILRRQAHWPSSARQSALQLAARSPSRAPRRRSCRMKNASGPPGMTLWFSRPILRSQRGRTRGVRPFSIMVCLEDNLLKRPHLLLEAAKPVGHTADLEATHRCNFSAQVYWVLTSCLCENNQWFQNFFSRRLATLAKPTAVLFAVSACDLTKRGKIRVACALLFFSATVK